MTFLHRAGLAGLLMTLENIDQEPAARQAIEKAGGQWSWSSSPTSVTLRWNDEPGPFLKALLRESFKVDDKGLIWFLGIGAPSKDFRSAICLHNAVLGTFLQHPKSRSIVSKGDNSVVVDIDGKSYPSRYRKLASYKHQDAPLPLDGSVVAVAGWQYPGGVVRHSGHGDKSTALEEPLERFLPLLFAPVGAIYFIAQTQRVGKGVRPQYRRLRRHGSPRAGSQRLGEGVRPQYTIVIPDIPDLQRYVEARRIFLNEWGIEDFYIAGSEEAALRVMAVLEVHRLLGWLGSGSCHVISFGTVPWSQQKTRVQVFSVKASQRNWIDLYKSCRSQPDLLPHLVQPEGREPFIYVPQFPSLVATNLVHERPWWLGFSGFVADPERWEHMIMYEQNGLSFMVEDTGSMPNSAERIFVKACHEAWRNRLGMLAEDARNRNIPFSKTHDRERERIRMAFAHCKDQNTFRETITNFWARSGPLDWLKERWGEILPFIGPRWQEGRDLALLALASYRGQSRNSAESVKEGEKEET